MWRSHLVDENADPGETVLVLGREESTDPGGTRPRGERKQTAGSQVGRLATNRSISRNDHIGRDPTVLLQGNLLADESLHTVRVGVHTRDVDVDHVVEKNPDRVLARRSGGVRDDIMGTARVPAGIG